MFDHSNYKHLLRLLIALYQFSEFEQEGISGFELCNPCL